SFHAPVETQRVLAHSLDRSLQAQLELQKILFSLGINEVVMPDISTKEKAQEYIGLDMQKLRGEKDEWIKTTLPTWIEKAKAAGKIVSNNI
ncbi:MAG: ammonia-forming cytochrome c nitrite reductase subunit c552, partial [Phocaeicola sp.]